MSSGDETRPAVHEDPASSLVRCLYLDTTAPFSVNIYRHRDCVRLQNGFWHTEILNQRSRMGNALDRSPQDMYSGADTFPFPDAVTENLEALDMGRTNSTDSCRSRLSDCRGDGDREWILCGCLRQKVDRSSGFYRLRLSPSMTLARGDHLLEFAYRDVGSRERHGTPMRRTPTSTVPTSRRIEVPETPVVRRSKRKASASPSYGSDGPDRATAISPMVFRVAQIDIGTSSTSPTATTHPTPPKGVVVDLVPTTGRHSAPPDFSDHLHHHHPKSISRKRKLFDGAGADSSATAPNIQNIQKYLEEATYGKRPCYVAIPTSQPSASHLPSSCGALEANVPAGTIEGRGPPRVRSRQSSVDSMDSRGSFQWACSRSHRHENAVEFR